MDTGGRWGQWNNLWHFKKKWLIVWHWQPVMVHLHEWSQPTVSVTKNCHWYIVDRQTLHSLHIVSAMCMCHLSSRQCWQTLSANEEIRRSQQYLLSVWFVSRQWLRSSVSCKNDHHCCCRLTRPLQVTGLKVSVTFFSGTLAWWLEWTITCTQHGENITATVSGSCWFFYVVHIFMNDDGFCYLRWCYIVYRHD